MVVPAVHCMILISPGGTQGAPGRRRCECWFHASVYVECLIAGRNQDRIIVTADLKVLSLSLKK